MNSPNTNLALGHRLLQFGVLLFLIGLLTGFIVPMTENPRMGLSSHVEAVMNGTFLIVLGLVWPKILLTRTWSTVVFWLVLYATFANWIATLLAAFWGAGVSMPIAAMGRQGSALQESIINVLLFSLSFAMVVVCLLVLWGLRAGIQGDRQAVA